MNTPPLQQTRSRHLLCGRLKRAGARARLLWAAMPFLVALVVTVLAITRTLDGAGLTLYLVTVLAVAFIGPMRRAVERQALAIGWRARWALDVRSAGLERWAEPGLRRRGGTDGLIEVVPSLVRVEVLEHGRRYTVRPLPGQALADFENAVEALGWRWRAEVAVYPVDGRREQVALEVYPDGGLNDANDYPH